MTVNYAGFGSHLGSTRKIIDFTSRRQSRRNIVLAVIFILLANASIVSSTSGSLRGSTSPSKSSNKESSTNGPLTLFAITDINLCSNDLPFGDKSSWDNKSPYFCTDCALNVSNFWLQMVSAEGNLRFSIIWQFDTLKTLSQRLEDASKRGEAVTWIVTASDGSVKAMRGIWRWGSPYMPDVTDKFLKTDFCFGAGDYVDGMSVPPMYGYCSSKVTSRNNDNMCGALFEDGEPKDYDNVESKMYTDSGPWSQVGKVLNGLGQGNEFGHSSGLSLE